MKAISWILAILPPLLLLVTAGGQGDGCELGGYNQTGAKRNFKIGKIKNRNFSVRAFTAWFQFQARRPAHLRQGYFSR
jgi:hypothetical protein